MAVVETFRCVRLARRAAVPATVPKRVLSALAHSGARRTGPGVRDPKKHIDAFWKRLSWDISRYGDGTFPVLYSSLKEETSLREVFYHIEQDFLTVAPTSTGLPPDVLMGIFKIDLKGRRRSVEDEHLSDPDLVHPINFDRCQDVGRASYVKYRFLRVPSARCFNGVCTPAFSEKAIFRVGNIETFDFTYDSSSSCYHGHLDRGMFSVDIQDVHGHVLSR